MKSYEESFLALIQVSFAHVFIKFSLLPVPDRSKDVWAPGIWLNRTSVCLAGGVGGGGMLPVDGLTLVAAELGLLGMLSRPPVTRAAKVLISSAVSIFNRAFRQDSAL